jgi:hypothetical protein
MAAASLSSQKLCARRRQNQIVVCLIRTVVLMQSSPWPRVSLGGLNATEIGPAGAPEKATRSQAKKAKKRIEGQREMLLPITGKKGKEAPKPAARTATRQKKAG